MNLFVNILIPLAASPAIRGSLHASRIEKIAAGAGLTISGLSLMAASGVPRMLKSWCWTNGEARAKESSAKNALRWTAALVGLASTCCGIYNIATGILEVNNYLLDYPSVEKPLTRGGVSSSCKSRLIQAKDDLLSCPEAKNIWNEVKKQDPFIMKCVPSQEAPFGARVNYVKREIYVSETSDNMVGHLLFELRNLKRTGNKLIGADHLCELGMEEYARAIEEREYRVVLETYKISDNCFRKGFWPENWRIFQNEFSGKSSRSNWSTLEGYLATQERVGHTALIRKRWVQICALKNEL